MATHPHLPIDARAWRSVLADRRAAQRWPEAVGAAVAVGAGCAIIWGGLVGITGLQYELEWAPMIGTGFLVGQAVRYAGRGIDARYAWLGLVAAFGSAGFGTLLQTCLAVAWQIQDIDNFSMVRSASLGTWARLVGASFGWIDVACVAFTAWEAYHFGRAPLDGRDLARITGRYGPALSEEAVFVCARRHRFEPSHAGLSEREGRLVCPRCRAPLAVEIARAPRPIRRKLVPWGALLGMVLIFPAFVFLTWLSVSRWSVNRLVPALDGDRLAVALRTIDVAGGRLRVWDLRHDREIGRIGREQMGIDGDVGDRWALPEFLADGRLVAVHREADGPGKVVDVVYVWDPVEGSRAPVGRLDATATALAVDAAGRTVVLLDRLDHVHRWDLATGREILRLEVPGAQRFALDPSSARLAIGSRSGGVGVWDLSTAREIFHVHGHEGPITGLVFDPSGTRLASVAAFDRGLRVVAAKTGELLFERPFDQDWLTGVAFHPDGRRLAVCGGSFDGPGRVELVDLAAGQVVRSFPVKTNTALRAAFTPDGRRLLAGSGHTSSILRWNTQGRIYTWDVETGEALPTHLH